MARRRTKLPAAVRRLRDQIERWRRTRARRTAMPAELWSAAVELARTEGTYRIARALRLNFEGLKRRMAEARATAGPAVRANGFVEFIGAPLVGGSPAAVVEVVDVAGNRLRVELGSGTEVDVARLISAFGQRSGG